MDFIGAFLQAPIRNAKFYVKLDSRYKDACPEGQPNDESDSDDEDTEIEHTGSP